MNRPSLIAATCLGAAVLAVGGQAFAGQRTLVPLADAPGPETARIATRPLVTTEVYLNGTPVDGTHTAVAGGRGSLAVGLLFGPVGVLANAAHAEELNKKRAVPLDGFAHADTVGTLAAIRQASQPAPQGTRAYELMPIVTATFEDDKTFHVSCMITASLPDPNGKRPWRARYSVDTPGSYDATSQASIDQAGAAVSPCLAEANRLFEGHARGAMQLGETAKPVVINGRTVQLRVVDAEYPTHSIVPDMAGIMEWAAPVQPAAPVPPCACNPPAADAPKGS